MVSGPLSLPRFVVAAPASGHGKTTVATGLMAALRAGGLEVSGHKVGPDYIDPGYHALATGRPGRNLDPHLVGEDLVGPLFAHGALTPTPADVAVVEGVMGLYDGALGRDGFASTAHVAAELDAPVLLVVDISHAARSIAAVVHGMASFDPALRIAGVVLNKAGSHRHAAEAQAAVEDLDIPVLGVLHRDDGISAPSRHLGLVPAAERPDAEASLRRLADQVAEHVDLAAVLDIARSAPDLDVEPWDPATALAELSGGSGVAAPAPPDSSAGPVVAVAGGRAFTFRYAETDELLRAAGCRVVVFDPTTDTALPEGTAAIYLGGGFPEMHAAHLGANTAMLTAVRDAVRDGMPTVAECAGLLYLCDSVDGTAMAGVIPAAGAMTPGLTLGYRIGIGNDTLLTRTGERVTGHEFHRTTVVPRRVPMPATPAWTVGHDPAGYASDTLHASYLHTHWAGHPQLAARFAAAAREHADRVVELVETTGDLDKLDHPGSRLDHPGVDLRHHGDQELADGLVDLAVNVHPGPRPRWLDDALRASLDDLASYPDATAARHALAARHGLAADQVLPTAGGAEAFTLVARMRRLAAARRGAPAVHRARGGARGRGSRRRARAAPGGRRLHARPRARARGRRPGDGRQPHQPDGRAAPADDPRAAGPAGPGPRRRRGLHGRGARRARVAGCGRPGVLVVRSLTKTWALPGVRAGYVVGDPALLSELSRQQPPWSVSTSAAAAMVACSTPAAVAESDRRARLVASWRATLVELLSARGLTVVGDPVTPFVLASGPLGLRDRLREQGFAVRRGDTFPGLGPEWVRVAVRDPGVSAALADAVTRVGVSV